MGILKSGNKNRIGTKLKDGQRTRPESRRRFTGTPVSTTARRERPMIGLKGEEREGVTRTQGGGQDVLSESESTTPHTPDSMPVFWGDFPTGAVLT